MKITFTVRVGQDQYWDSEAVEESCSVNSDTNEIVISSVPGALAHLKKMTTLAIAKRIKIETKALAAAAIEDAALEALQEETDEDSTDEG